MCALNIKLSQDPEISGAFYDVSSNPANFIKYQNNPKIAAALELINRKFGISTGGFAGKDINKHYVLQRSLNVKCLH